MTAIQIKSVRKTFGSTVALNGLDIDVDRGEIYGLLGPNGAGKSTTIDVLMDYTRPDEGKATVFSKDVKERVKEVHEQTGVLPDGFSVLRGLSGAEHVEYAMDAKGVTGSPGRTLRAVGLEEVKDEPAEMYSKGMKQRLVLAMALAGDPDLLLLDEPFNGLDPNGVRLFRRLVREYNENGTTVFLSTHLIPEVVSLCHRVGILVDGQLVEEGKPAVIVSKYDECDSLEEVFVSCTGGDYGATTEGNEESASLEMR